ncbi:fungal-specific transcription factor domain-containing protein [Scheffersomyces coipomensis]|uniref:fungal-specific transcription factor domain-containing protein n=1 Tax=Scheffersomyces coipomensis TaxID=1788519 RepID=UPI00315D4653
MLVTFTAKSEKDSSTSQNENKPNKSNNIIRHPPPSTSDINTVDNRISKVSSSTINQKKHTKSPLLPLESVFEISTSSAPSASKSSSNSTFKVINNSRDFSFKNSKRSRNGCLTCKIRKKKCDEGKPICSACERLSKECIWIDADMSEDEIRLLKEKVEQDESNNKLRKRKVKSGGGSHHNENNVNHKVTVKQESSSISPPMMIDSPFQHPSSISTDPVSQSNNHVEPIVASASSISSSESKSQDDLYSSIRINNNIKATFSSNSPSVINAEPSWNINQNHQNDDIYQFETHIHDRGISITKVNPNNNNINISTGGISNHNSPSIIPESPKLFQYNNSDLRSTISPSMRYHNNNNNNNNNNQFRKSVSNSNLNTNYALSPNSPTIKSLMNPVSSVGVSNNGPRSSIREIEIDHQANKLEKSPIQRNFAHLNNYHNQNQNQNHNHRDKENSPPPLDLDSSRSPPPLSPSAFLNFIRDLSNVNNNGGMTNDDDKNNEDEDKIVLIDDNDKEIPSHESNTDFKEFLGSSNFSAVMESMGFGNGNNDNDINNGNNSNNNQGLSPTNSNSSLLIPTLSPASYGNLISNLNSMLTPSPRLPPSHIPELSNATSSYLYNYYVEVLSRKISIAPVSQNDSNSYQKVFLPLAHKDKGVLYGILAWAGFYLGGTWAEEGVKYVNLALEHLSSSLDKEDNSMVPYNNRNEDRQSILNKLATLLILCGAEICKGDVKYWSVYLRWGWKILSSNGGILNFNNSKEEHWLISNFAYHDLLASSSIERGTYFSSKEYNTIFIDKEGYSRGNLSPLLGVSKKLYRIIGDVSTLVYETRKTLNEYYKRDSPASDHGGISESPNQYYEDNSNNNTNNNNNQDNQSETSEHGKVSRMLDNIVEKARNLEAEIDNARPEPRDLDDLTDEELELQLTLFEAFQLSAKLFLKQSIMKCNPSMLECQILNNDLMKCIDILLDSPVQASLVFPIFISGIHCVSNLDRENMKQRVENFIKLYGPWNVRRAKYLMEKVWQQNRDGDTVVDWHSILRNLDWDINFA